MHIRRSGYVGFNDIQNRTMCIRSCSCKRRFYSTWLTFFSSAVAVVWQHVRQMGFWLRLQLWVLCAQVKIHPTDMAARTVNQVNSDAPTYTAPSVRFFRAL